LKHQQNNLISGIHLTYKVVTPDTKRKQNNVFWNFSNIGLILVTLINWLLKPKCMLIHIFEFLLYENMIWFFFFEILGPMHENKKNICWNGPDPTQKRNWVEINPIKYKLSYIRLDSTQPHRLSSWSNPDWSLYPCTVTSQMQLPGYCAWAQ